MSAIPEILEVFRQHRTVRHYLFEPLVPGHLDAIVEAGRRAPTDASGQMYAVLRITDRALRGRLAALCGRQPQILDAAEFLVVCLDVHRLRILLERRGGRRGIGPRTALIYGATDATMVAQNMVVAAEALGYGTCYIGALQEHTDDAARELALPEGVLPLYGLCIGVPDPERVPSAIRPRIPASLTFREDRYREPSPEELDAAFAAMSASRDWYEDLARFFGEGGVMAAREAVMARAWRQQRLDPA